jgi:hypothetical protein
MTFVKVITQCIRTTPYPRGVDLRTVHAGGGERERAPAK